jgi:glyoxylase-like metal-dependent hydrolase (beta-lactamase superfamily II)
MLTAKHDTEPAVRDVEAVLNGLWATAPQPLPFAPEIAIRAYLLERSQGNVLLYSVDGLDEDAPGIRARGGIERRYLNHGHEAMFAAGHISVPLFVHAADRAATAEHLHVRGTFSRRHLLDDDLEVIPTPGHTPGATAYLWDDGRRRMLFTGDTIMLRDGEWVGAVLDSSDRAAFLDSLDVLAGLDFDVLVPWAASASGPAVAHTGRDDARRRLEAIAERVRHGASG